jgi:hypothetical protein
MVQFFLKDAFLQNQSWYFCQNKFDYRTQFRVVT